MNTLGKRNSTYVRLPSKASYSKSKKYGVDRGTNNAALKISYDKKKMGGPYGNGGWCGFYTLTRSHKKGEHFDVRKYPYLTFWVKGEKGDETFEVGVADPMWEMTGDSARSREIGEYLPAGKINTQWQLAIIPTEEFWIDWSHLNAISICFEEDLFGSEKSRRGTVYIDDIAFFMERPSQRSSFPIEN